MRADTVFVIGAGASCEVGLPLGATLKNTISNLLTIKFDRMGHFQSGDRKIVESIHRIPNKDPNSLIAKCQEIANAIQLYQSIDELIDSRGDDELFSLLGKHAIVKAILDAERKSSAYVDSNLGDGRLEFGRSNREGSLSSSYLPQMWNIIRSQVRRDNLDELFNGVSFICFNYDRCLEHFLFYAIQDAYSVNSIEAANLVSQVPIIHPYGVVGSLRWQSNNSSPVDFGAEHFDLVSLASNIKTYTERVDQPGMLERMRTTIQQAHTIVFLGMAFHEQNMDLLALEDMDGTSADRVFGTVYGMSQSDQFITEKLIERSLGCSTDQFGWFSLQEVGCSQLLRENGRLLSQA